jgi:hypothetical protein
VAEIDLLGFLVIFEHREIDDPAEFEFILVDQAKLFARPRTGGAGQLHGLGFLARGEEDAVVGPQAQLSDQLAGRLLAMILGDRAAKLAALGLSSDEVIAELLPL